jgi:hypothetical protein
MIRSLATCALILSLAMAAAASAQDEGRGERGGGEGGWGGRRGGERGGGGDFLRRIDANGNGMIDPEEAEGRAGGFLRRMAEGNAEIDFSQPVPLEKLEQSMAAARERWSMGSGGPPRSEDGGGERRDSGASSSSNNSNSTNKTPERLVPGFGEEVAAAEVPGFGLMTKALAVVKITDADRQEAQRRMGWFDRNNDGVLDGDEFEQARGRGYDEYDSNKDNKLTIDELAMRYAKRRAEEEASAKAAAVASSSSSSSSTRRDEGSRSSKPSTSSAARVTKSSATKPYRIASADERLAKKGLPSWFLDKDDNGDGQVAMAEYGESWTDSSLAEFAKFDLNSDGVITPAECLRAGKLSGAALASSRSGYGSRSSSGYGSSSRPSSGYGSRTEVSKAEPPKTPPLSSDSTTRSSDDEEEGDDDESRDEESSTASVDSNRGGSESSTDRATDSGSSGVTSAQIQTSSTPPKPAPLTENVAIDPRYMSYAQGRIKQVDANGDGILQPDEWIKMTKAPNGADTNGDKQITPDELALFFQKQ